MVIFTVPTLLCAWLLYKLCHRVLARLGAYDRPTNNAGFERPNGST